MCDKCSIRECEPIKPRCGVSYSLVYVAIKVEEELQKLQKEERPYTAEQLRVMEAERRKKERSKIYKQMREQAKKQKRGDH